MIKTSLIALMTVVAVSGAVAPAYAAAYSLVEESTYEYGNRNVSQFDVLERLNQSGVNATSVEQWNGLVRAFVRDANGVETMQYFDRDTLAPVSL